MGRSCISSVQWGAIVLMLGVGILTPAIAQAQSVEYLHTDAIGSVVAISNAAGVVIERNVYEPYGANLSGMNDGPSYAGHVSDAVTGLGYMQQRYYDSQLGRFLSVDPVTANGNTGANFNRYWYAASNPYRYTDHDGRQHREKVTGSNIARAAGGPPPVVTGNDVEQTGNNGPVGAGSPKVNTQNALGHYQEGSGTPLRVDFKDVDTSGVKPSDFGDVQDLIAGGKSGAYPIDNKLRYTTNGDNWGYLGDITLRLQGTLTLTDNAYGFRGTLKSYDDFYDFNKSTHRGFIGEVLTGLGRSMPGTPYPMEIRGAKPIEEEGSR